MKKYSQKIIDEIINLYTQQKFSLVKIENNLHIGHNTVAKILKNNNIEIRKCYEMAAKKRNYKLNESYFEKINDKNKAYWLGFFAADGHNRENIGISIGLQKEDKYHLEQLALIINSNTKPTFAPKTNSYTIGFWSKKLSQDLMKLGFYHNKSQTCKYPIISNDLNADFIRGYLDGDGNIQCYNRIKNGYSCFECIIKFCGTLEMMQSISNVINQELNIPKRNVYIRDKCKNFGEIKYDGRKISLLILNWLYKDTDLYLERKYKIYQEMKKIQPRINRPHKYKTKIFQQH